MPLGRIILKSISASKKLSLLKTDTARLLYTWLLLHLESTGCFDGDPQVVNSKVFSRLGKKTNVVENCLKDLEAVGLIIRYETKNDKFLYVVGFVEKTPALNPDREGKPTIPKPTPEQLRKSSGLTPAIIEDNNNNKDNIKDNIKEIFQYYCKVSNRTEGYSLTPHRKQKIKSRLDEGFTIEQMKEAIDIRLKSDFHLGKNERGKQYIDIAEHIFRSREYLEDILLENKKTVKPDRAKEVLQEIKESEKKALPRKEQEKRAKEVSVMLKKKMGGGE